MRYFLICYIINLRRNSLCQVKETITQNSLSWMLSTIEMNIRILLKLNVPRILALVLVHLPIGIGVSTLAKWESRFRNNDGDIPVRGSGNYQSDDAKEIALLKRELRDAQDALDVLKKAISILGKS